MSRCEKATVASCSRRRDVTWLSIIVAVLCAAAGSRPALADNTVTDWNNEFLLITQETSSNLVNGPPEVAREIAQLGEAMSDAVNAATNSTIPSFDYTGGLVVNANPNVSAAVAAYSAIQNVLTDPVWSAPINSLTTNPTLASNTTNTTLAAKLITTELEPYLTSQLSTLGLSASAFSFGANGALTPLSCGSSNAACIGFNLGIAAASAVNNATSSSPSGAGTNPVASGATAAITNGLNANIPSGSGSPGVYVPPASRPEMFPTWGTVTPTGATAAQVTTVENSVAPPAIGSAAYANALMQTECQGFSLGQSALPASITSACIAAGFGQTAAQTRADATAALFWNDPGTTTQPPGHWLQIADTALLQKNASLLQSAQLTALEGEAMNDAGIAAWDEKYTYNLWRPFSAIQSCGPGGTAAGTVTWSTYFTTCDATWTSLIATPPHPDFVAGHPAFSGAAATVLADFFGSDNLNFSSTSDYYCNGGTANVNAGNQTISCTLGGFTYYICSATTTPQFNNSDLPVDCVDSNGNITALTGANCNTVTSDGVNNGSPLICAITESYSSFSDASSGPLGSEFSRVVGGIHTPFSVEDGLEVGNAIGADVAANAGLPDVLPEPSSLSIGAIAVLALASLRWRRPVRA